MAESDYPRFKMLAFAKDEDDRNDFFLAVRKYLSLDTTMQKKVQNADISKTCVVICSSEKNGLAWDWYVKLKRHYDNYNINSFILFEHDVFDDAMFKTDSDNFKSTIRDTGKGPYFKMNDGIKHSVIRCVKSDYSLTEIINSSSKDNTSDCYKGIKEFFDTLCNIKYRTSEDKYESFWDHFDSFIKL